MLRPKLSRITECLGRPQSLVLLLLPCLLALTLYVLTGSEPDYERFQLLALKSYNTSVEVVNGYLVYNPKCHMLSKNPYDPSIIKFVKREKYETCSPSPLLTSITLESNGSVYLVINTHVAKKHKDLACCWAPITRPAYALLITNDKEFDSKISVGLCEDFDDRVLLPKTVENILVTCRNSKPSKPSKGKVKAKVNITKTPSGTIYENVHAILNPEKVQDRLNTSEYRRINNSTIWSTKRPQPTRDLSVLMLGIDSVSRLNFHRAMSQTRQYFDEKGWLELRGYNKVGDNTFPNLLAFLSGQNFSTAFSKCAPKVPYGLDNCSLIWYNFRDIGYITAYGEDAGSISTFNNLIVGFVDAPTDYYLRPYVIATEKLLKLRYRFEAKYCTGPEVSVERIFNYAVDFAKTFINQPYFGFFWTNSISHENMNGPSTIDTRFLAKLQEIESAGVMNDSMVIVLSDHGMRYGEIRPTFVGWYEERLPFISIWLPEWFREQDPGAYRALRINQNRLTSPYDLYETLRDILQRSGGQAVPSSGCPKCGSLFKTVPYERGCKDAGIAPHWCTCSVFEPLENVDDKIVQEGAERFVVHMENVVKRYTNKLGMRLCSTPRLKKIIRVERIKNLDGDSDNVLELFYYLSVSPGDMKFETTIKYHGPGNYTISDEEVSRVNTYATSAKCLDQSYKQYCHCLP